MSHHQGSIAVHFHDGFLDGQVARSGEPLTGGILDYWNAERFYATTVAAPGAFMSGVSPEGLHSMVAPSETSPTVVLHHRYRVTESSVVHGVLNIHASYEHVSE
ncbi:MAG: hypothetical protein JNG89_10770 [Planctomycetaceae bacterium]|nr:hypothetical protein [Planctomycetaceae bacterium]